ncbi:MAG TPA: ABC transporter ATP-binding protein [Rhodocyclaceae bacterium]|nr:MAG: ABC transporter ATP-binding protein [Betaproteobacteria bacterium CG2_30_68_42]PIV73251.1 MAG: ABC transporter ATP-binding protein [Rhodocyclales bacterium CG17_big_fil_post_rev_8_21_14_2_50_68_7]PIX76402.1 MAG: ABC transporter ATP-binding protein [Rhodocyclales bacterium CG_4_10_14_3_um_filter_68_10]HCX34392.1 ABC transporter ATP-binding protein [Rhodocyclaceae bacterium]
MLQVSALDVYIERTQILREVSAALPGGAMAGLIGRNGAGKTTLMRAIMGAIRPTQGTIRIGGTDVTRAPAHGRARLRVGYMPEDRRLVPDLTVEENILVPAWAIRLPEAGARLAWIYELIPEVAAAAQRRALQLSGGQQKLVALARALMAGSHLMLLDEPFEGIAPALAHRLVEVLHAIKAEGLSILLSESDYTHSAGLIDKLFVIERGSVAEKPHS